MPTTHPPQATAQTDPTDAELIAAFDRFCAARLSRVTPQHITLANSPLVGRFFSSVEGWTGESTDGMAETNVWPVRLDGPPRMNPAHWWGSETKTDNSGKQWRRSLVLVHDDFGNLVEVAA